MKNKKPIIIGYTKSNKPVYLNKKAYNKVYDGFTKEDHYDAADIHDNCSKSPKIGSGGKYRSDKGDMHACRANLEIRLAKN